MRKLKRIISSIIVFSMALSTIPVFAENSSDTFHIVDESVLDDRELSDRISTVEATEESTADLEILTEDYQDEELIIENDEDNVDEILSVPVTLSDDDTDSNLGMETIMIKQFDDGSLSGSPWGATYASVIWVEAVISGATIYTYTGSEIKPAVSVTFNGTILTENTDYTLTYSDNIDAGTGHIQVDGIGEYGGSTILDFTIQSMDISKITVTKPSDSVYTGSAITKSLTVKGYYGETLTQGTDYSVTYMNNVNAGTATIEIMGLRNYTGTMTTSFTITQKPLSSSDITSVSIASQYYTGFEIKPTPTIKFGSTLLVEGIDYVLAYSNNKDVGTATITATGIGNFSETKNITFSIIKSGIDGVVIQGISDQMYTGSEITPDVNVSYNGLTLSKGVDYTVSYSNNINVSTDSDKAVIKIKGTGTNFSGETTISFNIVQRSIADTESSVVSTVTYTGSALTPEPVITFNGTTLVKDTDYTLNYDNNVDAGTAEIKITGKGNYIGSSILAFTILPYNLSGDKMSYTYDSEKDYTGSEIKPPIYVSFDGTALTEGVDFIVTYSNNIDVGTGTALVTGLGNFTGTYTCTFTINYISASDLYIAEIDDCTYTGNEIKPEPYIVYNGKILVKDSDYTVSYSNNINVGDATVTITGKGAFAGTTTTTFKIVPKNLSDADISAIDDQTYTGDEIIPDFTITCLGETVTTYTTAIVGDIVNVGVGHIRVTGTGNFDGSRDILFNIVAKDISDNDVSVSNISDQSYTGDLIQPEPVVSYNGKTLEKDIDYSLIYTNNKDVGTATVVVAGKANFKGSVSRTFDITTAQMDSVYIAKIPDQTYTGTAIEPSMSVSYNGIVLSEDINYEKTYSDNINAGTATVTIEGKSPYYGTQIQTFNILPAQITSATISKISDQDFDGNPIAPKPIIVYNGIELSEDTDYILSYENNMTAGVVTITITGINNFTGTTTETFNINALSLADAVIGTIENETYTGDAIEPMPSVMYNGIMLIKDVDYEISYDNNVNAGTAMVVIKGINNYKGTVNKVFTIYARAITEANITLQDLTYNGDVLDPMPELTYNGKTLTQNVDYSVSYIKNQNAGTATLTIAGIRNFTGVYMSDFEIARRDISEASIEPIDSYIYDGDAKEPKTTLTYNGYTLYEGTDYEITSYEDNIEKGTATVNIAGINNFTGTTTTTFTIVDKTLNTDDVEFSNIADQVYTGSEIKPEFDSVVWNKLSLEKDVDYELSYANNINVGEAFIYVAFKGNYSGSAVVSFNIIQKDISDNIFDNDDSYISPIDDQIYTGNAIVPKPEVVIDGKTLEEFKDYELSYEDNIEVGTATIIISFEGNYSGEATTTFEIIASDLDPEAVSVSRIDDQTYTGEEIKPEPDVLINGTLLEKDVDYELSYRNNVNVGTATISIKFIRDYTGSVERNFVIVSADVTDNIFDDILSVEPIEDQIFTGEEITPKPVITEGEKLLTETVDYNVSYRDNVNVGEAAVIVSFIKNYSGSAEIPFNIVQKDVSDNIFDNVTSSISKIDDQVYTGYEIEPKPEIMIDNRVLNKNSDYTLSYEDNIEVGTATITISFEGNYSGEARITFEIVASEVDTNVITVLDIDNQAYTGSEITPKPTVLENDTELQEGVDYDLSYKNNIEVGTATINISFKNNYSGTITKEFNIISQNVTDNIFDNILSVEPIEDQTFTGKEITPKPVITENGTSLVETVDYNVSYRDNINVGEAAVILSFIKNYSGSAEIPFNIVQKDVSDNVFDNVNSSISKIDDQIYTGYEIEPKPEIMINNRVLSENSDYTLSYENNITVGTATIIISFEGNYSGEAKTTFEIIASDLDPETVSVSRIDDQTYTGKEIKPEPDVFINDTLLEKDVDYELSYRNNVNVGTATISVKFIRDYTGSIEKSFNIISENITDNIFDDILSVEPIEDQIFTGEEITPKPVITENGTLLVETVDYNVSYRDNINVGEAAVIVSFIKNYSGSTEIPFNIVQQDVSDNVNSNISKIDDQVYTGYEIEPKPEIIINNRVLSDGVDYELSYENNINIGTATIIISFKGNYSGEAETTFKIVASGVDTNVITVLDIDNQVYTGSKIEPKPTVLKNNTELQEGVDYDLSYRNNIEVGTATISIKFKNNYSGTMSKEFNIVPWEMTDDIFDKIMHAEPIEDQTFTGEEITPKLVITEDGTLLVETVDYNVSYRDNINVGEAAVIVSFIKNYSGSIEIPFNIVQQDVSDNVFDNVNSSISKIDDQIYTGYEIEPKPEIIINNKTLNEYQDYELSYKDNINVGIATITIVFEGNYSGEAETTFKIVTSGSDTDAITVLNIDDQTYTGLEITPKPTVLGNNTELQEGVDYELSYRNNIEVGIATVSIKFKNNYSGTMDKEFNIVPWEMTDDIFDKIMHAEPIEDYVFTGKEITPTPVVTINDEPLIENDDYTVSYRDNINVGKAAVIVTFIKNYSGSIEIPFNILPKELTTVDEWLGNITIEPILAQEYTGEAITPDATIQWDKNTLINGVDYDLSYENNINPGTASVIISLKNNYKGELGTMFDIVNLNDGDIIISEIADQIYTGDKIEPVVEVKCGDELLVQGTDYNVSYTDNVEIGKATAIVTMTGSVYTGEYKKSFNIVKYGTYIIDNDGNIIDAVIDIDDDGVHIMLPAGWDLTKDVITVNVEDKDGVVKDIPIDVTDAQGIIGKNTTDENGIAVIPPEENTATDDKGKAVVKFVDEGGTEYKYIVFVTNNEGSVAGAEVNATAKDAITVSVPDNVNVSVADKIITKVCDIGEKPAKDINVTVKASSEYKGITDSNGIVSLPAETPTPTPKASSGGGGGGGGGGGSSTSKTTPTPTPTVTPTTTPTVTPTTAAASTAKTVEEHKSYINGYGDNVFMPDANMTRAEAATIFARLLSNGKDISSYKSSFKDVDSNEWYYKYIGYLEKYKIITGYEDKTFKPDGKITRAEFVTMVTNVYRLDNANADISSEKPSFSDVNEGYWYFDNVGLASVKSWIKGYEDGTFGPDRNITRAEVVTIVNHYYNRAADTDYIAKHIDEMNMFTDVPATHWAYYEILEAYVEHKASYEDNVNDSGELWQ